MNSHFLPTYFKQAVSASIALVLMSCSSPRGTSNSLSTGRHPNLLVQVSKVSPARLISDEELQNAKSVRRRHGRISVGKTIASTVMVTGAISVNTVLFAGVVLAAGRGGGTPPDFIWPTNMPKICDQPAIATRTVSSASGSQIKLSGSDLRYVPARRGNGVELARVRGGARVDVSDRLGSYYCRADEIHYRADTHEIILNGRASISAVYAPDVHDFGLTRVNLATSTVEYSSGKRLFAHTLNNNARVADVVP